MRAVRVEVFVACPPERVWRALTVASEVASWDGVTPIDVPDDYPLPGQHARWSTRVGPVRLTLHDRIQEVDRERVLASTIDVGFVHIEEEYHLSATGDGTKLLSLNHVSSPVPGLGPLAVRLTRSSVSASMERLRRFCEFSP